MEEKVKFNSIDGLRAFAAIGIIMMHIAANTQYNIKSSIYSIVLPQFATLVFLFMIISSFGICCGYYEKIKNNKITLNEFYQKRYSKILPFFSVLVLLDLLIERNLPALYESIMNLTLTFSFLPNSNINIIGVGWTLGVIFAFYMLYPFFVFLLDNRKRAWFSLLITIIIHIICIHYFFTSKFVLPSFNFSHNILYCSIFFITGGVIYLYKDCILKYFSKHNYIVLLFSILLSIIYFTFFEQIKYRNLYLCLVYALYLIYAINSNGKLLNNKITKFLSKISFEIYLCHMLIFRLIEKMNLLYLFGNSILSFIVTCILVTIGAIFFSIIVQKIIAKIKEYFNYFGKRKAISS